MIEVYHNPRCTKSRQAIKYLEEKGIEFKPILYLKEGLNQDELEEVVNKLNYKPIDLIRKNEAIWKSEFKAKQLTDEQIIMAMIEHPKLMERPIIINGSKAIVARPTEKIEEVL